MPVHSSAETRAAKGAQNVRNEVNGYAQNVLVTWVIQSSNGHSSGAHAAGYMTFHFSLKRSRG